MYGAYFFGGLEALLETDPPELENSANRVSPVNKGNSHAYPKKNLEYMKA